jgi:hypothetical protein
MTRELSATADAAIFAPETCEVFIKLIEIDHPDWDEPFRFCQNSNNVVSNGDTYEQFPFTIEPPNDSGNESSQVTLLLDNVKRTALLPLRQLAASSNRATVTLKLVLASEPDTVIGDVWEFTLMEIGYNGNVIQCSLLFDDIGNEPFPSDDMSPANNPGLFKEGE